jgi:trimethylamine--corrinoid protein Co-methyltransferase
MSTDAPSSDGRETPERRDRPRRRGGERGQERAPGLGQLPWQRVRNAYRPVEILDTEQIEKIHDASMTVLESIGMDFLSEEARDLLRAAGADVDAGSARVRFDRGFIMEKLSTAPATATLFARDRARAVTFGDRNVVFASVASAPYVSDLDRGRRIGNFADFQNLLRVLQSLNIVHAIGGYPVEPQDLPPETRHLDCYLAALTLTDRVFHPYALGRARIRDAVAMLALARGTSVEALKTEPGLFTVVNTSSPLRVDGPMLEGLIEMARAGQVTCVTPFTLAGAMSPVTVPGALAQQNAEALAVIAFAQIVAPGSPAVYGGFTSNVDMRSGAPTFGTPEYAKSALIGGQLARRYGLPYRSSNVNTTKVPDAQAAYESMMSLWPAVMGGANLVMHAAGWLEGGLCASFEKIVIDAECLQMMASFLEPPIIDDDTLAVSAMQEVGPGGHFFGAQHTLARYETAFYAPILSDWRNFESWQEAGSKTAAERANGIVKRLLADYRPPPIDAAIAEALRDYVERRRREIR